MARLPKPPKGSAQRTREAEIPIGPQKRSVRIREIVKLMAGGRWVTGVTGVELAERWHVARDTMKRDAATASGLVRDAVADTDEIRGRIIATLETITQRAMKTGQLRTAVESIRTLAGVSGAEAAKKVSIGGNLSELLALGLGPGSEEAAEPLGE